jgi:hypothetical protein
MLMCDGNIVYQGIANRAPKYFEKIGYEIASYANPADVFMRIISIDYPKQDKDEEKLENLVSNYRKRCEPGVLKHMKEVSLKEFAPRVGDWSEPPFKKQLMMLLSR